jgi:hypothetical protein
LFLGEIEEEEPMPIAKYNRAFGGGKGAAQKALAGMKEQYGAEKGERVFYATVNRKRPGLIRRKAD